MKPINYLDPVVCPDGCVKPLSEFAGGGSGGAVDCVAELVNVYSSGNIISAVKIARGGGVFDYVIKYKFTILPKNAGITIIEGFAGGGVCSVAVLSTETVAEVSHHPVTTGGKLLTSAEIDGYSDSKITMFVTVVEN